MWRSIATQSRSGTCQSVINNALILWHLGGGSNQRRVGCRITGLVFADCFQITSVSDNDCHLFELFK